MAQPEYKIKANIKKQIQSWKEKGESIVFTNGCFDILHPGHIQYLKEAKALGKHLIVGLNSDGSVEKLKGKGRPILALKDRTIMLEALKMVDLVIPFDEETPANLINQIIPDILVKGGDYSIDTIVGAKFVLSKGGQVRVLSFKDGFSTSKLINKIIELNDDKT